MATFVPSESILSLKVKHLKRTATRETATQELAVSGDDAAPFMELYTKHCGDLKAIFKDLGEDPGKALKYPPLDAEEFAEKYVSGKYTYVDARRIVEKVLESRGAEAQQQPLVDRVAGMEAQLLDEEDTAMQPIDVLKAVFNDVDEQVVSAVWNANNGHLESTVETLLIMTMFGGLTDVTQAVLSGGPDAYEPAELTEADLSALQEAVLEGRGDADEGECTVSLRVPEGISAGANVKVSLGDNTFVVTVPPGLVAGDPFVATFPV